MKQRVAIFLFLIGASSAALGQAKSADFSLTVGIPKSDVALGEPIPLTVVMTNNSDRAMEWGRSPNERRLAFLIKVVDQKNQLVPQTAYGREMSGIPKGGGPVFGSYWADKLPPGKSVSAEVRLDKEYEIENKGTYRVQVERFVDSGVHLTSNEVVLTVR